MIDKKHDDFLGQNIKGLMMTLLARWNSAMDEQRAHTEFADVRPADIRVFAQLRGRTVRLSEIHKEMGFSRQAAKQAVDRLVGHGMIQIGPDSTSKRDKLVSITDKGQRWRAIAAQQIKEIETQVAATIGADDMEALRQSLLRLLTDK